ncbi:hypothetical protein B0O80DRAFT_493243 [Mortierella sp. GBAus27b]|nr:hypothetical protein BGX31_007123 [Mortierella sp. GBA43]KAI8362234.1 hypothetical protein B0O80DRAFT_493243 [Mortierella sp. GBAus27b]
MFNITELDEIVCSQLSHHDMTQCIRVCKRWHAIVAPFLWRDLRVLDGWDKPSSSNGKMSPLASFCMVVLQDYLRQDQKKSRKIDYQSAADQPDQERFNFTLSTLTRFGPWVQHLPSPYRLLVLLQPPEDDPLWIQAVGGRGNGPTSLDLLRHLYKHCHFFQVPRLFFKDGEDMLLETISEFVIPRTESLHIWSEYDIQFRKLIRLLDHCSDALTTLVLDFPALSDGDENEGNVKPPQDTPKARKSRKHLSIKVVGRKLKSMGLLPWSRKPSDGKGDGDGDEDEDGDHVQQQSPDTSRSWKNLKLLGFKGCGDKTKSKEFWPWLWERCEQVEELELRKFCREYEAIVHGMESYMPNLSSIHFNVSTLKEEEIVRMLLCRRQGWKQVVVTSNVEFANVAGEALLKHCSTLEKVVSDSRYALSARQLIHILTWSPHLHTLHHSGQIDPRGPVMSGLSVNEFIDRDPATGLPKPWICEKTLRELNISIMSDWGELDAHSSNLRRDLQNEIYGRMGRLVKLEKLCLKDMELSMASGLDRLSGLKNLKELNISRMIGSIGVEEFQWMTENWPRWDTISGPSPKQSIQSAAVDWLKKERPEMAAKVVPWYNKNRYY